MSRSPTRATGIVFSLFVAGVLGGAWAGSAAAQRAHDPYAPLDTLVRVLSLIETTYVDEIETDRLVAAAIDGMLQELDPHSTWMSPWDYRDLQRDTHGSYTGIGVELRSEPDGARIVKVLPGGPAALEGLQVGDLILAVDGLQLHSGPPDEALIGPRGTTAVLDVLRPGWEAPRKVQTLRDVIHAPTVEAGWIVPGIAYVRLIQFREGAATELEAAFTRLQEEAPLEALIVDVRDNPGGLLREAVSVADLFLDEGTIVSTWGRLEKERTSHEATVGGLPDRLPIALLVNGRSASASEILAGALQDTGRATLFGTRTYGKGSVQTVFEHRDGSALKLTIGRYYTPSGEPVAPKDGREPDVVVEWPTAASPIQGLREAIDRAELSDAARAELLAAIADMPRELVVQLQEIPWDRPLAERAQIDPQLAAALRHLQPGQP